MTISSESSSLFKFTFKTNGPYQSRLVNPLICRKMVEYSFLDFEKCLGQLRIFSKVVPKFVSIVASVVLLVTVDLIPKLKLPCTCSRNFTRSLAVATILSLYISASPKSLNKIFLGEPSFSVMPSSPAHWKGQCIARFDMIFIFFTKCYFDRSCLSLR